MDFVALLIALWLGIFIGVVVTGVLRASNDDRRVIRTTQGRTLPDDREGLTIDVDSEEFLRELAMAELRIEELERRKR